MKRLLFIAIGTGVLAIGSGLVWYLTIIRSESRVKEQASQPTRSVNWPSPTGGEVLQAGEEVFQEKSPKITANTKPSDQSKPNQTTQTPSLETTTDRQIQPPKTEDPPKFERRYPKVIKGNWEPAGEYLGRILDQHLAEIKALGVNTVSVVPGYEYRDGRPYLRPFRDSRSAGPEAAKQAHLELIKKAKQAGLDVLVSPDFVGGENKDLGVSQDQFIKDMRPISLEWAEIAETYQVEYFCPSSELNWVMKKNYFSADESNERAIAATEQYYSDILPELRARFKGKLYFKAASQTEPINMSGYDLIGLDFGHYGQSPEKFKQSVREYFEAFSRNAKTSHAEWVVGEVWLPYQQPGQPAAAPDGRSYDELQDDLFQIVVDEYRNFTGEPKPIGLFFIAYLMPGLDIKDRPAEAVIKDFFAKL